jgi:hypothetical protein
MRGRTPRARALGGLVGLRGYTYTYTYDYSAASTAPSVSALAASSNGSAPVEQPVTSAKG